MIRGAGKGWAGGRGRFGACCAAVESTRLVFLGVRVGKNDFLGSRHFRSILFLGCLPASLVRLKNAIRGACEVNYAVGHAWRRGHKSTENGECESKVLFEGEMREFTGERGVTAVRSMCQACGSEQNCARYTRSSECAKFFPNAPSFYHRAMLIHSLDIRIFIFAKNCIANF